MREQIWKIEKVRLQYDGGSLTLLSLLYTSRVLGAALTWTLTSPHREEALRRAGVCACPAAFRAIKDTDSPDSDSICFGLSPWLHPKDACDRIHLENGLGEHDEIVCGWHLL